MLFKYFVYFFQFTEELLLIVTYAVMGFVRFFIEERQSKYEPGKPTIMIVQRWLSRNFLHDIWKGYLQNAGFNVFIKNFPLQKGSFDESAEELKKFIEDKKIKDFVLVGISGGGVTGLTYLNKLDGWNKVRHFITIGCPLKGTPAILPLTFLESARELLPGSSFLKALNSNVKNKDKITCIQAKFDEMVPSWSSSIEGAEKIVIDVAGHNILHMTTKKTYETISHLASTV